MRKLYQFLFILFILPGFSYSQEHKNYTASFVSLWAEDTASIETFTILGNHIFGKAIQLFPEPRLSQFSFWYNEDGSLKTLEIEFYQLQNTSLPLESKTGLFTRLVMNSSENEIKFQYVNKEEERTYLQVAPRMDFFGGWIPVVAQFEWLVNLFNNGEEQIIKDLKFVNYVVGVFDLELSRINDKTIQFKSSIMEPVKIEHNDSGKIEFIDAIGSGWNFKIYKTDPIDIEKHTKRFANKPVLGDPSPHQVVSKKIEGATIEIDYGRPSKRNREIFGNIVPYDAVWRTGSGPPTTIKFDKDIKIRDKVIPKGKYNLYTIPKKDSWTLIFNIQENAWGSAYKKEFDLEHVEIPAEKLSNVIDQFTIAIEEKGKDGNLKFMWDKTMATINFKVLK